MQLTHLTAKMDDLDDQWPQQLSHLSCLVDLQHLAIDGILFDVPGVFPSQLVKLTTLDIRFDPGGNDEWQPYQLTGRLRHLSSFTALETLTVYLQGPRLPVDCLLGIEHLSRLSRLELDRFSFAAGSTSNWTRLAALESLTLEKCTVQPQALAVFTQLRALSLLHICLEPPTALEEFRSVVRELEALPQLTLVLKE
jgi:hypothetical protein